MIRCPACKTVLAVSLESAEATPPLPFGPAPVPPAAPPPPRPPVALPSSPPLAAAVAAARPASAPARAVDVDIDPSIYDPNQKRRRRLTVATERAYEDLDEDEKRLYRKMERLRKECGPGRAGMMILAWTYRLGSVTYLLLAVAGLLLTFDQNIAAMVPVVVGLNALFAAATALGLGLCAAGPKGMRVPAGFGAVVALASAACSPLAFTETAKLYHISAAAPPALADKGDEAVVHYATMIPTHCLPLIPGFLFLHKLIPWLAIFAAVLELTRHFVVCAVARNYAEEGKDPDLGFRAIRYLFRLMLIMIVVTLAASGVWAIDQKEMKYVGMIVALNLGVLTMMISLAVQGQALSDISEIVDPKRFVDRARRLELD